MEETRLIANSGTVSIRKDRTGRVMLGISRKRNQNRAPDIEVVLTERQMQDLAEELHSFASEVAQVDRLREDVDDEENG